jgi:sec-independent protein translocase protein TatA
MGNIGMPELLIVLLVVVVIFGGSKIPQLGKGLGEGIRNFKAGLKEINNDPKDETKTEQK